jgi:hypothetical protein
VHNVARKNHPVQLLSQNATHTTNSPNLKNRAAYEMTNATDKPKGTTPWNVKEDDLILDCHTSPLEGLDMELDNIGFCCHNFSEEESR